MKLAALMLVVAFVILFQQYLVWGKWFEVSDIHHETFSLMLGFGALTLLFVQTKLWKKFGGIKL